MKAFGAVVSLLHVLAQAAEPGKGCDTFGAWDCAGDAEKGPTLVVQCAYITPGANYLNWTVLATCQGDTPCCDQSQSEMNGNPHCNVRPVAGPHQDHCGLPGP